MKVTYPVIFTDVKDNILIEVPDLKILTQSNDSTDGMGVMANAIEMARDAIGLKCIDMEDNDENIIAASKIQEIDIMKCTFYGEGECIVSLVDVDLIAYRKKYDNKTVRRNVTLPNWLNREAERAHINVSRVLQEALMSVLGVSK